MYLKHLENKYEYMTKKKNPLSKWIHLLATVLMFMPGSRLSVTFMDVKRK